MDAAITTAFEQAVTLDLGFDEVRALAQSIKAGTGEPRDLAAALARAAFLTPETLARTYDAAAEGWLGEAVNGPAIAIPELDAADPAKLADLWTALWSFADDSAAGAMSGALEVTTRTAGLSALLPPEHGPRLGQSYLTYPMVRESAAKGLPPRFDLETLKACPANSLGRAFYDQIIDNSFDLEVLDRDVLGLANLPAPHDFINTRMLQSHDLIHLLAGYEVTSLHEVGISGFQLAQCGHGYSAVFLAVVSINTSLAPNPGAFSFLMDIILAGWTHGRRAPSLVSLEWEEVWHRSMDDIRQSIGLKAFDSPYPADIIEQLRAAA